MALLTNTDYEMDKLTYEIFSILESRFLSRVAASPRTPKSDTGKVRILSIDSGDGLLAAVSLARLEASLRANSNNPDASIADFFDVAAGSGLGGVLIAMLFTKGPHSKPLFSAEQALHFLNKNRRKLFPPKKKKTKGGLISLCGILRRSKEIFEQSLTLHDTLKPVLIPCYDLSTGAPFLFSRADAVETDAYNFRLSQVCAATCAEDSIEIRSIDGRTSIVAIGGGVATSNPTSAAITHVLNNKQEFPYASTTDDLLVVSLGNQENRSSEMLKIATNVAAETVDQAIATAFGDRNKGNYVRIQANLAYRNVESLLFRGSTVSELTNAEKLERFSGELVKEQKRRESSLLPSVVMTPRTSSATACTTATDTTTLSV